MPEYTPEFQRGLDEVLRIDPSLKEIVDAHEFKAFLYPKPSFPSSFEYLTRGVMSQQVTGAASRSICKSFMALCGSETEFPPPKKVLEFDVQQLRDAGLSRQKAAYILGLAEAYEKGEMSDEILQSLSDDEIVDKIVSLKGFGPWSAQMFLVFYMHRMNVFSPADVGIQRGMRRYIKQRPELLKEASGLDDPPASPGKSKKSQARSPVPPDLKHMDRIAQKFAPHRTVFQCILWKLSDIQMDTVEARNEDEGEKRERLQAQAKRRKINAPVEVVAQKKSEARIKASDEDAETTGPASNNEHETNGSRQQNGIKEESKQKEADGIDKGVAAKAANEENSSAAKPGTGTRTKDRKRPVKIEIEDAEQSDGGAKSNGRKGGRPRKQQRQ